MLSCSFVFSKVRHDHCRHVGSPQAGGGSVPGDAGGRQGRGMTASAATVLGHEVACLSPTRYVCTPRAATGRRGLRHGFVHRSGGARPGPGLQGRRRSRCVVCLYPFVLSLALHRLTCDTCGVAGSVIITKLDGHAKGGGALSAYVLLFPCVPPLTLVRVCPLAVSLPPRVRSCSSARASTLTSSSRSTPRASSRDCSVRSRAVLLQWSSRSSSPFRHGRYRRSAQNVRGGEDV